MKVRAKFSCSLLIFLGLIVGCSDKDTGASATKEKNDGASRIGPRLDIQQTSMDAGEADFSVMKDGKFLIRNGGDEALTLLLVGQSCLCTEVLVPREIPVGQEGTVVMRWTPKPGQVGPMRLRCELRTNDPAKLALHLEMQGTVNPSIRIWPENISLVDFGHLYPGDRSQRELKIFSTKFASFDLDAKLSKPEMKLTKRKLDANCRIGDYQPTCAYALVLETTPDLKVGAFSTALELTVKPAVDAARTLQLWVNGTVDERLFNVSPEEITFRKPQLSEGDVQKVRVQFLDPKQKHALKIACWSPTFLQCEEPRALPGGAGLWEFSVGIPANNAKAVKAQAEGSFEGEVLLQAWGSEVQVPIRVRWMPQ